MRERATHTSSVDVLDPIVPEPRSVSVILVAYHGDQWLPACIDSLADASTQRLHLVLVDNTGNSILDTLRLDSFECEIIKTPRSMGFAEANNYALVHASRLGNTVLFLNQDTISHPGWIDHCLRCFMQDEHLGAVSPLIRTYDDDAWDPSFLSCLSVEEEAYVTGTKDTDWFSVNKAPAPALLVRTEVLGQTGPFDPIFGSYYEDYDLCRRIRSYRYKIGFCNAARVNHFSGSSTNDQARELRRMQQIIRNRFIYRLREAEQARLLFVLKHFITDVPRRLMRGLLRTPSSQPPTITLKAYRDLLRIAGRLISRRQDEKAWKAYLDELGWLHSVPGRSSRGCGVAGKANAVRTL